MANFLQNLWIQNKALAIILILAAVFAIYQVWNMVFNANKFTGKLSVPISTLTTEQPKSFPPVQEPQEEIFNLSKPDVPEEIGLSMLYPQGQGVGMSKDDSNSFYPDKPGPLLTTYKNPESYGESSLTDPSGTKGADQGCRVIRFTDTGDQLKYQPFDESNKATFASAFGGSEVQKGLSFVNGASEINYTDSFNPENNLVIQTSPGQTSTLPNCEKTYPNVVKFGESCITEGDIPYGQVVDGKVNPRLVSRWESYTGDYSRQAALNPVDGVLYPNLNVLTNS
jgi:hypothetical protein